jgi:toxin ParE1/3/4
MKPVRFHPAAEAEMVAAGVYYEQQLPDLGKRFLVSALEAVSRIRINPQLYPVVDADVRRCLTRTFPFAVLYREQPDQIVVVAVMHLHRDPGYWKNR